MEQNVRLGLINAILTTPHRALVEVRKIHEDMMRQDALLYAPFGVWYMAHGEVRDHQEVWVATLLRSDFPEHRDAAFALLQDFPPYQVARVIRLMKGFAHRRTASTDPRAYVVRRSGKKRPNPREPRFGGTVRSLGFAERMVDGKVVRRELIEEVVGPFRSVPRSTKSAVTYYLRTREANEKWFDRAAVEARNALRYLYSTLRIKPSARAQAILFDDNPPANTASWALKQIAHSQDSSEQARLMVEYSLSFRVVVGAVKERTPALFAALVNAMSPQDVINNMGALKKAGAFENPEIKSLIDEKIAAAKTAKRVSALKTKVAAKAADVSEEVAKALDAVAEEQLKAKGTIRFATGLVIDKSGSLEIAIEVGKRIAAMVAGRTEAPLYIYACNELAYPITLKGPTVVDAERAFRGIEAHGATSIGVGVEAMRKAKQMVDQFVVVTDEGENRNPRFVDTYRAYVKEFGISPHVIFVKVRGSDLTDALEKDCEREGISFDVYDLTSPKADYNALPGLLPILARKSQVEFLMEILATPLPKRPDKK